MFEHVLATLTDAETREPFELPKPLSDLLSEGVVANDDGTFLRALYTRASATKRADFPDRTGFECFVNHIHFSDFAGPTSEAVSGTLGLTFALVLCDQIGRQSLGHLRFIVSVDLEDAEWTFRFHLAREGEAWLAADLEQFKTEGIMVIDLEP